MRQATLTPEERKVITTVYQSLLNPESTLVQLKQSKNTLHELLRKCNGSCWSVVEHRDGVMQVVNLITIEKDPKRIIELVRAIGTMFYYFGAPVEFSIAVKDIILKNLVHENGHVRDTAKRIISNWGLHDFEITGDLSQLTIDFITELVALIRQYEPIDKVIPIESMKPSVYKSLLLAYEELVCGDTIEGYVSQHENLQIEIIYTEFEEVTDRKTQLPLLWKKYQCTEETKQKTLALVEKAYARLQFFLELVPFTPVEITHIRSQLAVASTPYDQETVVEYVVFTAMKKQTKPQHLGPVIREIQAIANHTLRMDKDIPFTYFLLSARTVWTEELQPARLNLNDWMDYVSKTHLSIDTFCDQFVAVQLEHSAKLEERLAKLVGREESTTHTQYSKNLQTDVLDCCSIAHHIADWLFQSYPSFTSKTPEKLAAICLGAVSEINQGTTRYYNKDLALFGGWKAPSSVMESARTAVRMLREVVLEPTLFCTLTSQDIDTEEREEIKVSSPLGMAVPGFIRFYVVVSSLTKFTPVLHARLHRACDAEASTGSCVVESFLPYDNHAIIVLGIHQEISPQSVVDNIIISANAFDPFLRFHFLITNTHVPSTKEVNTYLESLSKKDIKS